MFLFSVGGQQLAVRISKQVRSTNTRINKLLAQFNGMSPATELDFNSVKDPCAPAYTSTVPSSSRVPYHVKRQSIDAYNMLIRSEEEIILVKKEMRLLVLYHTSRHSDLLRDIKNCLESGRHSHKALLCDKAIGIERRLMELQRKYSSVIDLPPIELTYFEGPGLVDPPVVEVQQDYLTDPENVNSDDALDSSDSEVEYY